MYIFLKKQRVPVILKNQMQLRSDGSNLHDVGRIMAPKEAHVLILGACENVSDVPKGTLHV